MSRKLYMERYHGPYKELCYMVANQWAQDSLHIGARGPY